MMMIIFQIGFSVEDDLKHLCIHLLSPHTWYCDGHDWEPLSTTTKMSMLIFRTTFINPFPRTTDTR
jgi:hypothetical protein